VSIAKGEAGGSSPHTRGARSAPASPTSNARIIPAYAGSTPCRLRLSGRLPDHPRIRGEHRRARFPPSIRGGSSPHTRGALDVPRLDLLRVRIIPAYAGSTGAERLTYDKTGDHPRIRGEHPMLPMMVWNVIGSSPHTRGARSTGRRYAAASGIIPAYAGSTPCLPCARPRPADHPRIRGEHQAALALLARMLGSSPHTRGARGQRLQLHPAGRIIPAYAGSTFSRRWAWRRKADHPRIRGEHPALGGVVQVAAGSSPHTRGARGHRSDDRGVSVDHPRIRGEHVADCAFAVALAGSSPHTRGALDRVGCHLNDIGIIPAYAGSTRQGVRRRRERRDHPRIRGEHSGLRVMDCPA